MKTILLIDNIHPTLYQRVKDKNENYELNSYGLQIIYKLVSEINNSKSILWTTNYICNNINKNNFYSNIIKEIEKISPSIIGLTSLLDSFPYMLKLISKVKYKYPNIKIVWGGPKVSSCYSLVLKKFNFIDFVYVGEAETNVKNVFEKILNNDSSVFEEDNLAYKKGDSIIINKRNFPINMTDVPLADNFEYYDKRSYIPLEVGRGCPYSCEFCLTNNHFSRKYRIKSFELLYSNIQYLSEKAILEKFPYTNSFSFIHDNLFISKKDIDSFITEYKKNNASFIWKGSLRIEYIDENQIRALSKINLERIFFGIESASQKINTRLKKNVDLAKLPILIGLFDKYGIGTVTSFIYGFPYETYDDLYDTLEMIYKLNAFQNNQIHYYYLHPQYGSSLTDEFINQLEFIGWKKEFINFHYFEKNDLSFINDNLDIFIEFCRFKNPIISNDCYYLLTIFISALQTQRYWIFLYINIMKTNVFNLWMDFNAKNREKILSKLSKPNLEFKKYVKIINKYLFFYMMNNIKKYQRKYYYTFKSLVDFQNQCLLVRSQAKKNNTKKIFTKKVHFDFINILHSYKKYALGQPYDLILNNSVKYFVIVYDYSKNSNNKLNKNVINNTSERTFIVKKEIFYKIKKDPSFLYKYIKDKQSS